MNQKPPPNDPVDKPLPVPPRSNPRYDEALLDEAVAETLPASDPIAPATNDGPTTKPNPDRGGGGWKGWPKK